MENVEKEQINFQTYVTEIVNQSADCVTCNHVISIDDMCLKILEMASEPPLPNSEL